MFSQNFTRSFHLLTDCHIAVPQIRYNERTFLRCIGKCLSMNLAAKVLKEQKLQNEEQL